MSVWWSTMLSKFYILYVCIIFSIGVRLLFRILCVGIVCYEINVIDCIQWYSLKSYIVLIFLTNLLCSGSSVSSKTFYISSTLARVCIGNSTPTVFRFLIIGDRLYIGCSEATEFKPSMSAWIIKIRTKVIAFSYRKFNLYKTQYMSLFVPCSVFEWDFI